mmetsp:Transcript_21044/g.27217  ORF Transcript_21044/g.27217 Transcript_21044/m.27217 type:complete len:172 (+) Transcript_21044:106-621(+)
MQLFDNYSLEMNALKAIKMKTLKLVSKERQEPMKSNSKFSRIPPNKCDDGNLTSTRSSEYHKSFAIEYKKHQEPKLFKYPCHCSDGKVEVISLNDSLVHDSWVSGSSIKNEPSNRSKNHERGKLTPTHFHQSIPTNTPEQLLHDCKKSSKRFQKVHIMCTIEDMSNERSID